MLTSIKSVGSYVPSGIMTNADLEKMVETSDTWIRERTGIHERRIAAVNETATDLAAEAALDALAAAGMRPQDTDLIVSGGESKQAIVIGSETLTKILNFKDRGTCVVFGDGAGAVVLGPSSNGAGIKSSVLGSDGSGGDLIYVAPGADGPEGRGRPEIRMDGRKVFRFATAILAQATLEALEKANVPLEDVKLIVPHQANARIIEAAGKRLGVGANVMVNEIANYGNTSTESIPLAIKDALAAGRLKSGDHLVLVGFGAGLTWGACVIKWEGAPVRATA